MTKLAVIALGGNAILRGDQRGTTLEQYNNLDDTLKNLVHLIKEGCSIVLSHGNGPQVGNILLQNDAGESQYDVPAKPLDVCVADSQGSIGYMMERTLKNVLKKAGIDKDVVTIVTQVVVSKTDPAFQNFTKRVGKLYSKDEADKMAAENGWAFKPSPKKENAWRRVVPSPRPIQIMNELIIKKLANSGVIVIASGGGGIPVYYDENGFLQPVEAVIDKDAASSLLATRIGADELYILTDVPYVYNNFGQPNQEVLKTVSKKKIEQLIENKAFGEGNMLPKVASALRFVTNGGTKSIITEASQLHNPEVGTRVVAQGYVPGMR